MILVTGNWRTWLIGTIVSLVIFGVVYFTVIKPDNNLANQAVKSGLQQSQQVIDQAKKQLNSSTGQTGGGSSSAQGVSKKAQDTLTKAQKLASCVAPAGTDLTKMEPCQA